MEGDVFSAGRIRGVKSASHGRADLNDPALYILIGLNGYASPYIVVIAITIDDQITGLVLRS